MVGVAQNGQTIQSALYNYQGLRVLNQSTPYGSATTTEKRYSYGGLRPVAVHDDNGDLATRYFYGAGQLERLLDPTNGLQYYHNDALGSPITITDHSGIAEARYAYDAFGQYRRNEETDTTNIFGFTGHEWDEDTELLYAKARYYDPETARFLAQDPFEGNLNTPPSLHKYLYAYQNPTVYVDPDGRFPLTQQTAVWFNKRDQSMRILQASQGSNIATRTTAAFVGVGSNLMAATGGLVGIADAGLDLTAATGGHIPGLRNTGLVQDSVRKTNDRIETAGLIMKGGYDYATQENLGAAIKADAKAVGAVTSDYLGDVFIRGDLDATASWSGGMFDIASGGAAARAKAASNAANTAKILDEAPSGPKPAPEVPEWKSNSTGDYSPGNVTGDVP
jgi:RHS repeat-associated protein